MHVYVEVCQYIYTSWFSTKLEVWWSGVAESRFEACVKVSQSKVETHDLNADMNLPGSNEESSQLPWTNTFKLFAISDCSPNAI